MDVPPLTPLYKLVAVKFLNTPPDAAVVVDVTPEGVADVREEPDGLVLTGPEGSYKIKVRLVVGKKITHTSTTSFAIGKPGPGPTPVPPVPPTPPAPIPAAGLRVLVVYDALKLTTMTATQQGAIYGKEVRDYLRATCPKGDDGETPEVRMWAQDTDATGESKLWRDAFSRPRKSVPWVIVSNGKTGYEGPLPGSAADMLNLLKTYGDK